MDAGPYKLMPDNLNAITSGVRLDEAALDRLRELDPDGRHGVVRRVLLAFETSLSRVMAQLTKEVGQGRPEVVAGAAHMLKSSAASVGALALSACCAKVEQRRRGGDAEGLDEDVRSMLAEAESALKAVRAMLHP